MKFVITVFVLAFCVATAGATPVTTLSAGLYTFSNISCDGVGCADITASVSTQSTSEYGGASAITFSDNGVVVPEPGGVQLTYDVSYLGVDPRSYSTVGYDQTFSGTSYFAGSDPFDFNADDYEGGALVGGIGGLDSLVFPYSSRLYDRSGISSFSVVATLFFQSPGPNETTAGEFTTAYAAVDSPEPSSFGLFALVCGLILIQSLRRRGFRIR